MAFVSPQTIFDSKTVSKDSSVTAGPFKIGQLEGLFSLEFQLSGDGTLKFEYIATMKQSGTAIRPDGGSDILTGQTSSSGEKGDGHNLTDFQVIPVPEFYIRATETGTSNSVTIDWAILATR